MTMTPQKNLFIPMIMKQPKNLVKAIKMTTTMIQQKNLSTTKIMKQHQGRSLQMLIQIQNNPMDILHGKHKEQAISEEDRQGVQERIHQNRLRKQP